MGAISLGVSKALPIPPVVIALVIGIAIAGVVPPHWLGTMEQGIGLASRGLLRLAIVFLGCRLLPGDIAALGPHAVILVLASVTTTWIGGIMIARALGLERDAAGISATSVAICGAAAALAASAAAPKRKGLDELTSAIVVAVALLSTFAMLAYPHLATAFRLSAQATAALFGAGIHDVAHVAGAGLSVSESTSAAAIAVKMVRVACLLPVVVLLSMWFAKARSADEISSGDRPPALPLFLIGFALVGGLNMAGFMPSILAKIGTDIATYLLVISMAAIGLKTSIRSLMTLSGKLWLVLGLQTVLQLSVVLTLIHWLY
jgi:uncharacterized integral membrane protein (TIGR00698 family)